MCLYNAVDVLIPQAIIMFALVTYHVSCDNDGNSHAKGVEGIHVHHIVTKEGDHQHAHPLQFIKSRQVL